MNPTGPSDASGPIHRVLCDMESLFRREAIEHRKGAWLGKVLLIRPISLTLLVCIFAVALSILAVAVAVVPIPDSVLVQGELTPEAGLLRAQARQVGKVGRVLVEEGASVRRGQPLLLLSDERTRDGQATVGEEVTGRLRNQLRWLYRGREARELQLSAERRALEERRALLMESLTNVVGQVRIAAERLHGQQEALDSFRQLVEQGFISPLGLQPRIDAALQTKSEMREKEQMQLQLRQQVADVEAALNRLAIAASVDLAVLGRDIESTERELVEAQVRDKQVITAPVDGVVATLLARQGQSVIEGETLALVLPQGSPLRAAVCLPERAVPHVREDDTFFLRLSAFPYQTHGSLRARVIRVAQAPQFSSEELCRSAAGRALYLAFAALEHSIDQRVRPEMLKAGLQFNTTITIQRRTLLQILLRVD
jgi:membrane fusion protein